MREILFRGKCIDNGEWVEGYYYKMSETTYCFKEDYERKPVPEHHYILQERMTDWGLYRLKSNQKHSASSQDFATRMGRKSGKMILYL